MQQFKAFASSRHCILEWSMVLWYGMVCCVLSQLTSFWLLVVRTILAEQLRCKFCHMTMTKVLLGRLVRKSVAREWCVPGRNAVSLFRFVIPCESSSQLVTLNSCVVSPTNDHLLFFRSNRNFFLFVMSEQHTNFSSPAKKHKKILSGVQCYLNFSFLLTSSSACHPARQGDDQLHQLVRVVQYVEKQTRLTEVTGHR